MFTKLKTSFRTLYNTTQFLKTDYIGSSFLENIPFQQKQTTKATVLKSLENIDQNLAYAMYLPKEWSSQEIQNALDPSGKHIKDVRIIKDSLSNPTGRALLTMTTSKASESIQAKYREQFLDTDDVLQRIAIKSFSLKKVGQKPEIKRKQKQAYIVGLPRDMQNEQLLDLLIDFGEIENVQIPKDTGSVRNKGYALILFKQANDAQIFQKFMDGKQFLGGRIRVQLEKFEFDTQKPNYKNKSSKILEGHHRLNHNNYNESMNNLDKFQEYVNSNEMNK